MNTNPSLISPSMLVTMAQKTKVILTQPDNVMSLSRLMETKTDVNVEAKPIFKNKIIYVQHQKWLITLSVYLWLKS